MKNASLRYFGFFMNEESNSYIRVFIVGLICVSSSLFIIYHFYPGAMSPDSFNILNQARTGIISDAFPIFNAYLWQFLEAHFFEGPISMLVLNVFLYYTGVFLVFYSLSKYSRFSFLFCIAFSLFPPIVGILGVVWSDITMAAFIMLLFGLSVFFSTHSHLNIFVRTFATIFGLLIAFAAVSTRHNAAAAVIPMVLLLLSSLFPMFKANNNTFFRRLFYFVSLFTAASLVTFVLFFASKYLNSTYAHEKNNFWRVAALYDIAGVSCEAQHDYLSSLLESGKGLDNICSLYSARSFIPLALGEQIHEVETSSRYIGEAVIFRSNLDESNSDLLKSWIMIVLSNPADYAKHRIDFVTALTTRKYGPLWAPVFDAIYPNELGVPDRTKVESRIFDVFRLLSGSSFIFLPMVYVILASAVFIFSFVGFMKNSHRDCTLHLIALACSLSGLLHFFGVAIFAVSSDFRYSHWTIISSSMSAIFLLFSYMKVFPDDNNNCRASD